MRASVFIATSLDGFIARKDGGIDWLPSDQVEPHGFDEFWASVDAVVIGRGTFETVLGFGEWGYGSKPVFVLTTRAGLQAPKGAVCEFLRGDPRLVVDALEARGFQHIYVDGGVTIQRFLEAGLIQRMTITRIPILLGTGLPLFGPLSRDVRWKHVATSSYPSGIVTSVYEIAS